MENIKIKVRNTIQFGCVEETFVKLSGRPKGGENLVINYCEIEPATSLYSQLGQMLTEQIGKQYLPEIKVRTYNGCGEVLEEFKITHSTLEGAESDLSEPEFAMINLVIKPGEVERIEHPAYQQFKDRLPELWEAK